MQGRAVLVKVAERLEQAAGNMDLKINESKTKYIRWTNEEIKKIEDIKMRPEKGKKYKFEKVNRYLGTVFMTNPIKKREIQNRLMAGNGCLY